MERFVGGCWLWYELCVSVPYVCVCMVVGQLVWHVVGGGNGDVGVVGLVAVKLRFVEFLFLWTGWWVEERRPYRCN